jgi:hypothetical protein
LAAGNSVLLLVELSLKVVPRNEIEGSICQLGVDSIKLIQVSHGSFIAATMMVGLILAAKGSVARIKRPAVVAKH